MLNRFTDQLGRATCTKRCTLDLYATQTSQEWINESNRMYQSCRVAKCLTSFPKYWTLNSGLQYFCSSASCGDISEDIWISWLQVCIPGSNQVYFLVFMCTTFGKRFIFTKKSKAAKCFFYICINEIAPFCQKLGVILVVKWFKNWS